MLNLKKYYGIVEQAIEKIGLDPTRFRGEQEGEWTLHRGEYTIWIDVWNDPIEKVAYLQVVAPVMEIPDESQTVLFRELLQINLQLCGIAFSVHGEKVVLKGTRVAEGLDVEEAHAMIMLISKYVSNFSPILLKRYFNNGQPGIPPK
ncbi:MULTISPECIES: YbjN domain-containing protein [unclassified Aureispira]|uniref:YbjN domain-containing protein n=1 Tax=unclassified Aureispira TaxID=2649989 RepID=UPI0006964660|nr:MULTISPECIES: YbjN domain-containing protein [unclassified Aureispira]WMX15116.1 YbjN domain-containing protein [Aureispira sp. CCB-E]